MAAHCATINFLRHLVLKQAKACLLGRDFGSAAATEPAGLADFF